MLLLSACSGHNQIERDIKAYAERLQSFTNIDIEKPSTVIDLNAPNKIILAADIAQVSINLREFYAFKQCSLNQMIAQRNTALGKMQLPSSRFIYEHALVQEFSRCKSLITKELESIEDESRKDDLLRLVAKLSEWQNLKQQQLPLVWSNFVTQSNEIFLSVALSQDFISAAPSDNFQATRQAWQFIANSYEAKQLDSSELEDHLRELENTRLLAKIWRTQQYISMQLDAISPLLTTYLANNTCSTSKQEKDIEIMRNIFTLFFADKIQSLAAELNRYHYQLEPLLQTVIASNHLPDIYSEYINGHLINGHDEYKRSMKNHIALWQEIFARCN
jgi:hypothetical protein